MNSIDDPDSIVVREAERLLQRGEFRKAQAICEGAPAVTRGKPATLSLLGRANLGQGRHAEAVGYLEKALAAGGPDADVLDALGRAFNNLREFQRSEAAFVDALRLDPRRAETLNNLGHVLRAQAKYADAAEKFSEALQQDPDFTAAHFNLGTVMMLTGRPRDAVAAFNHALELEPQNPRILGSLALAHQTAGDLTEARKFYLQALERDSNDAGIWVALGLVHNELRDTRAAEHAFRRAIELDDQGPAAYAELAAMYEDVNRLDDAKEAVHSGLGIAPGDPRLNLEAAKLARRAGDPQSALARLEAIDFESLDSRLAQMVAYELGVNKDRTGRQPEAFGHFSTANALARKNERLQGVDASRFLKKIDRASAYFRATDISGWERPPADDSGLSLVFLFGFPRSGTTLTDLMLDSHGQVTTLEEKPTIEKLVMRLLQHPAGYPKVLGLLGNDDILELRKAYFAEMHRYVSPEPNTTIVDKMPIRTVNAGLIWRLFPDSKMIFSLRHPCDVCISCFMQQFNANDAFANFFTLADTVRVYDKIMNLWNVYCDKLPLNVQYLKYEDLIDDFEAQSRKLAAFLQLGWQEQMLDYRARAAKRGRIATNSYHQVTEALYSRSIGRWRAYAEFLEPHMDVLSPHIQRFGYAGN